MSQQSQAADYQAEQRAVSAHLIEEMAPLWELIRLGAFATTVPAWIDAVIELLQRFASMSGTLAADHYSDARDLAKARGLFQPAPVQIPDGKAEASLRWATKDLWIPEADGPSPIEQRLAAAEQKAAGAAQKVFADVGRDTVVQAVQGDSEALGWGRHASADACAFCRITAIRGPVYSSEETAGGDADRNFDGDGRFKYHDSCSCVAIPVFKGQGWNPPEYVDRWEDLYREASSWPGNKLRNFRRIVSERG